MVLSPYGQRNATGASHKPQIRLGPRPRPPGGVCWPRHGHWLAQVLPQRGYIKVKAWGAWRACAAPKRRTAVPSAALAGPWQRIQRLCLERPVPEHGCGCLPPCWLTNGPARLGAPNSGAGVMSGGSRVPHVICRDGRGCLRSARAAVDQPHACGTTLACHAHAASSQPAASTTQLSQPTASLQQSCSWGWGWPGGTRPPRRWVGLALSPFCSPARCIVQVLHRGGAPRARLSTCGPTHKLHAKASRGRARRHPTRPPLLTLAHRRRTAQRRSRCRRTRSHGSPVASSTPRHNVAVVACHGVD